MTVAPARTTDPFVDRQIAVHRRHPEWAGEVMCDQTCTFLEVEFEYHILLAVFWQREWAKEHAS